LSEKNLREQKYLFSFLRETKQFYEKAKHKMQEKTKTISSDVKSTEKGEAKAVYLLYFFESVNVRL
jgi:hypothetical protein